MNDTENHFAEGVRILMEAQEKKMAPLSVEAGLGETAIRDLFRKGTSPKVSTALAIAGALGTTIDGVIEIGAGVAGTSRLGLESPPLVLDGPPALVPVYDVSASAGCGVMVDDYEAIAYSLSFPKGYLNFLSKSHPRYLSIISVHGESMEPTLRNNDVVMLDSSKTDLSYDGMFVMRFDDALHVKRVGRASEPGHVTILSDNREIYPPQVLRRDAVAVLGKVVWYGRKV